MTTREAFETEARKHGFILDRLDKSSVYVQLITEQAWSIWQAATAAALEMAAVEAERQSYRSDCRSAAEAIRALKEQNG